MADIKYTNEHEAVLVEGDTAWVGITPYAKDALGDLVYIELPEVGKAVTKGNDFAVVESVKTAAEVYSPVDGEVVAANDAMAGDLEMIARPLAEGGWIAKIKIADPAQLEELMDEAAYKAYLENLD